LVELNRINRRFNFPPVETAYNKILLYEMPKRTELTIAFYLSY